MSPGRKGFSILELLTALGLFALLSAIAMLALRQVSRVWQRTSARDVAMRELLKAEAVLSRDLANAGKMAPQSAYGPVKAGAGAIASGDGLALIVPSSEQEQLNLDAQGQPVLDRLVTYYLAVPTSLAGPSFAADAQGYEDQCPFKWLVRKQTVAPAAAPGGLPAVPANWLKGSEIDTPTSFWRQPDKRVVASNLLQFRVVKGPPTWEITLTAVAIADARRQLALGGVPLSPTVYAITHQVGVVAKN
ncbi:MAG: prepilin-type N-terminal cleavage/methylation domain-containing protein [Vulcanimicrobiota bacterium]